jgi:5,10-methylenetetrahydromethanopterin reductase
VSERVGLGLLGEPDIRGTVALAREAEAAGFESLWVSETRITRDAVTAVTAVLAATERLRVGTAAINVFTRGAALTAVTFSSLAELAPGRVVLGLGAGSPGPLEQQGLQFDRPLPRLREWVEAIRTAWRADGTVDFDGKHVTFRGLAPEVFPPVEPPIYLCTTGPKTLRYAGGAADGVMLDVLLPPAFTATARAALDEGAGGSYRGEVACALMTSVAGSRAEAAARVRPRLARYLVGFPELGAVMGVDTELLERLGRTAAEGGLEATFGDLPDEFVARFAVIGTPADCRERVAEYRDAGVDLPVLMPDAASFDAVIRTFAAQPAGRPQS